MLPLELFELVKRHNRQLLSISSKTGEMEVFITLLELTLTSQGMKALVLEESHLAMAVLGMLVSMVFDLVGQILRFRSIQTGEIVIEVIATIVTEEIEIAIGAETRDLLVSLNHATAVIRMVTFSVSVQQILKAKEVMLEETVRIAAIAVIVVIAVIVAIAVTLTSELAETLPMTVVTLEPEQRVKEEIPLITPVMKLSKVHMEQLLQAPTTTWQVLMVAIM